MAPLLYHGRRIRMDNGPSDRRYGLAMISEQERPLTINPNIRGETQ